MSDDDVKAARAKIAAQIAKLMATANDASVSEAMAALYADKAQELLAKHNIEMSEIGAAADPTVKDSDFLTARAGWVKPLLQSVAKLYFCGYYYESFPADWIKRNGLDKGARKLRAGGSHRIFYRHSFIGTRVNIIVARNMGEYLITTMERLCEEAEKTAPKNERTSFRYSFMNACAARLCFRLLERQRNTSAVGDVKSGLPALRSQYEQAQEASKAFLDASEIKLRERANLTKTKNARGAHAGNEAGKSIGLDDQVSGGTGGRRRITQAA